MNKPAVLLLERSATVIEVVRQSLAGDAELHVANTIDLAVRIAERRAVVIGILDATMAGLSPADTVARLRAYRPGLRIVFLAEPPFDLEKRHSPLGLVLRKPVTADRLADTVRNMLRLQNMTVGVQKMRNSSGTFPAVSPPETEIVNASGTGSIPPPNSSPPGATESRTVTESGEIPVGGANPEAKPQDGTLRRLSPRPFARVR